MRRIVVPGAVCVVLNLVLKVMQNSDFSLTEIEAMILATFADAALLFCLRSVRRSIKNPLARRLLAFVMVYIFGILAMGWSVSISRVL